MGNSRVKDRFGLALDGKQVIALGLGVTVLVASVFVLGMNLGRRSVVAAAVLAAPKDPLARLDEPLPVRDDGVDLKAHQALTDARPIDKTLPVPQVKATTVSIAPPAAVAPVAPVVAPAPVPEDRPAAAQTPAPTSTTPVAAPRAPAPRPEKVASTRTEKSAAARAQKSVAARKEKSATSVATPPRKGSYAIQIASLSTRAEAERVAKQNAARHPRIVQADVPGKGHVYRVLVGSYESQDSAKRQLAVLTRTGVKGLVTAVR